MRMRLIVPLTALLFLLPVVVGLLGTILPAFGYLPAIGKAAFSLAPWQAMLAQPGVATSLRLSAGVGLGAAALAVGFAILIAASVYGTTWFRRLERAITPFLALPHAATAIGLALLWSPSGWIARLLSPWATGWDRPPDLALVQDPTGTALMVAIAIKELFFFLFMLTAAMGQVPARRMFDQARLLGYGPGVAWLKAVWPMVAPRLRLPMLAMVAYAISVVDMAQVLGPTTPPTFAVLLLQWFQDPDLAMRLQASAGALLLLALTAALLAAWSGAAALGGILLRQWSISGDRARRADAAVRFLGRAALIVISATLATAMALLLIWSAAAGWRFPDAWPPGWTLSGWRLAPQSLGTPALHTLLIAILAAGLSTALAVACLEHEARRGRPGGQGTALVLFIPLLVPQVCFLFGIQSLLLWIGWEGTLVAVVWTHLAFVLPYVFLSLAGPYRAYDLRYVQVSATLGASTARAFWRIKLPMLARPVAAAAAVGLAVSVAQYLPTLLAGVGRWPTLTTEAMALTVGGDRRTTAIAAFAQMALPLLAFGAAAAVGRRRGKA